MTREEAIQYLTNDWFVTVDGQVSVDCDNAARFLEAIGVAISSLGKRNHIRDATKMIEPSGWCRHFNENSLKETISVLKKVESGQLVEVVRCKDCETTDEVIIGKRKVLLCTYPFSIKGGCMATEPNHYCSNGKQRGCSGNDS